ncbi:hypothetical protein Tco_1275686 [Tanacetum coccineum]
MESLPVQNSGAIGPCAEVDVEPTADVLESSKAWLTKGQDTGVLVALTEGLLKASCSGEPKASQSRL